MEGRKIMKNVSCTNCGKQLLHAADIHTFQSVLCCVDCNKIVTHSYEKAERLIKHVLALYKESLRVALIKKQAHLPNIPEGSMPMGELPAAMNMLKVLHANGAKEQQISKDQV
jgi:hypothetical protein